MKRVYSGRILWYICIYQCGLWSIIWGCMRGNRWYVLTCSWVGRVVVVGACGERFLGVRVFCVCCVYGSAWVVGV